MVTKLRHLYFKLISGKDRELKIQNKTVILQIWWILTGLQVVWKEDKSKGHSQKEKNTAELTI